MQKFVKLFLLLIIIVSCQKTKSDNSKAENKTDFSSIKLKVERGAFHYDSFVLNDTTITFYPEKEINSVEHQEYFTTSAQPISKDDRDLFIQKIIDAEIWNLKEKYTPDGSCTTNLTVTMHLNDKTKIIVCDDYQRGCPDIIKFIENEIVRLHNKELKRIFLPG